MQGSRSLAASIEAGPVVIVEKGQVRYFSFAKVAPHLTVVFFGTSLDRPGVLWRLAKEATESVRRPLFVKMPLPSPLYEAQGFS